MTRFAFAAAAAFAATPALADMAVSIPFAAEIAGQPFACTQTYVGLGRTRAGVQAVDLRLFVANPALMAVCNP